MTGVGPTPVLFTHYGDDWFRGSEQLLFDLVTNLDRSRFEPILWCNGQEMAEAAMSAGIVTYQSAFEYYFDYHSSPINISRYRSFVKQGIELVRRHNVQVLHANSAAPNQWLVPVARTTRRPLLAHLHIDYRRRSRFACMLHQASLVVGVSRQVIADFLQDGMAPARTHVIYNGIDFARLKISAGRNPRQELGISQEAVVITSVGSLIRRKGQDILIRAVKSLIAGRDLHLLISSEGPERASYEALTTELGIGDRVHFLGYYEDIPAVYRATDIVALASRADAFGLVLAEAGYFALPAVATTVGGIPEVVDHGVSGLLVPPDDPDAMAIALGELIDDPVRRRALGGKARERALRLFSVEEMVANFQSVYEKLSLLPRDQMGWLGKDLALRPYLRLLHPHGNSTIIRK
jgi:glycosyltransferase involved in cell wall biosynthesis